MVAGGSISPLLGALYLHPLDEAMLEWERKGRILYRRFMDDFVILASSRHVLRKAIRKVHEVLYSLMLVLHPVKRFIGRTVKSFDFLGYQIHQNRKLRPSAVSLHRLTERARQLYERGVSEERLRQYVIRWHRWLHGGLDEFVTRVQVTKKSFSMVGRVPVLFHLFRSSFFPRRAANNHRRLLLFWHIFLLHLRSTGCYSRRGCVLMFQLL